MRNPRRHWLSFMHSWRPCYSAELTFKLHFCQILPILVNMWHMYSFRDVFRNFWQMVLMTIRGLLVLSVCLICSALLIVKVIFVIIVFFFLLCVSTILMNKDDPIYCNNWKDAFFCDLKCSMLLIGWLWVTYSSSLSLSTCWCTRSSQSQYHSRSQLSHHSRCSRALSNYVTRRRSRTCDAVAPPYTNDENNNCSHIHYTYRCGRMLTGQKLYERQGWKTYV